MTRRLLNLLTAVSLLVLVAAVPLWVRSHRLRDSFEVARGDHSVVVESDAGRVSVLYCHFENPSGPSRWRFNRHPEIVWPFLIPPELSIVGIEWRTMASPPLFVFRALTVPYWIVAAIAAVAPVLGVRRLAQRHLRRRQSRCARCGYDLRATPDRCPECGAEPAPQSAP